MLPLSFANYYGYQILHASIATNKFSAFFAFYSRVFSPTYVRCMYASSCLPSVCRGSCSLRLTGRWNVIEVGSQGGGVILSALCAEQRRKKN